MTPMTELGAWQGGKIQTHHLDRLAVVYVRQSTLQQVLDHQESTRIQYGLVHHAEALGWLPARVLTIDEDLGKSGSSAEDRSGFQRLVAEVGLNHVGLILGIEMSRLARSSKDWHQLLEICALFGTLIADLDGIYDPSQYNDRLLLGLKGTMSEAELHILKQRLVQGKLNKAQRGELGFHVPIGYGHRPSGEIILEPDEQARDVVKLIFRKFDELGTLNAVLRYLVTHHIQVGARVLSGPHRGELTWRCPNRTTLQNLLKNPAYAGAYAYGRSHSDLRKRQAGRPYTGTQLSNYAQLCQRLEQLVQAGLSTDDITQTLHHEGFRPPKQRQTFNAEGIRSLMRRLNLVPPRQKSTPETLDTSEWWLPDLARLLDMPTMTLYDWVRRGWVKARQQPDWPKHWIIWADETEIERLKAHRQQPFGEILRQRWRGEVPAIALKPESPNTSL